MSNSAAMVILTRLCRSPHRRVQITPARASRKPLSPAAAPFSYAKSRPIPRATDPINPAGASSASMSGLRGRRRRALHREEDDRPVRHRRRCCDAWGVRRRGRPVANPARATIEPRLAMPALPRRDPTIAVLLPGVGPQVELLLAEPEPRRGRASPFHPGFDILPAICGWCSIPT